MDRKPGRGITFEMYAKKYIYNKKFKKTLYGKDIKIIGVYEYLFCINNLL